MDFLVGRNVSINNVKSWNTNIFGNLALIKKRLLKRIDGIQISLAKYSSRFIFNLEKEFLLELHHIYQMERIIWAQKAGINWRKYADWNTKYFYTLAKIKKNQEVKFFV